jgi:hypothetical protein
VLEVRSFRLLHFLAKERSRERKERRAKVCRSMEERSLRWHHVTGRSEDLLADIPAVRESVEELRELSDIEAAVLGPFPSPEGAGAGEAERDSGKVCRPWRVPS